MCLIEFILSYSSLIGNLLKFIGFYWFSLINLPHKTGTLTISQANHKYIPRKLDLTHLHYHWDQYILINIIFQ